MPRHGARDELVSNSSNRASGSRGDPQQHQTESITIPTKAQDAVLFIGANNTREVKLICRDSTSVNFQRNQQVTFFIFRATKQTQFTQQRCKSLFVRPRLRRS